MRSVRPRVRLGPSLLIFALCSMSGGFGLLFGLSQASEERKRASELALLLSERTRVAAELLRDLLTHPEAAGFPADDLKSLTAQVAGLAEPIEASSSAPVFLVFFTILGLSGAAFFGVRARWVVPLAQLEAAFLEAETVPPPRGAPPIRSVARSAALFKAEQERRVRDEKERWNRVFDAGEGRSPRSSLEPEVLASLEKLEASLESRAVDELEAVRSVVAMQTQARRRETELAKAAERALASWETWTEELLRAETLLSALEPELEARNEKVGSRLREVRETTRSLERGLSKSARHAQDLAQQAARAKDAAVGEVGRQARRARTGGNSPEKDPFPIERWASELEATAGALTELATSLEAPSARGLESWEEVVKDALTAQLASVRASVEALEVTRPMIQAVKEWARTQTADLRPAFRFIDDEPERGGSSLKEVLKEVDAAALTADKRLRALARQAERLAQAAKG